MTIELKITEINLDLIKLVDNNGRAIDLPAAYFDHAPRLDETIHLNLTDKDAPAKDILNEIFGQK